MIVAGDDSSGDDVAGDESSEGDEVAEETPEEPAQELQFAYELDISQGKWYKTPEKALAISKAEFDRYTNLINEYGAKIHELSKNATGKAKGKAKGHSNANKEISKLQKKINDARKKIGYSDTQRGIHTYWANQPLILKVQNVSKAGWYELAVVAKNYGSLPKFYDYFNLSIINDSTDQSVGGIFVDASDHIYKRGSIRVLLEEGDTDLRLLWTNDAYKEGKHDAKKGKHSHKKGKHNAQKGEYDANIQIRNVTLKFGGETSPAYSNKKLVRHAHEYSEVDGRFFWDKQSVRTYWANQTIGFNFPELQPGKYRVKITAKNYGSLPLPDDFDHFNVTIDADGTSGQAQIPAEEKGWRNGSVILDLTGGDTDLFLTWTNDKYSEGEHDANIMIQKIHLQRVGDSERSALAAYLLGVSSTNKMLLVGTLMLLILILSGITLRNRKRARVQI